MTRRAPPAILAGPLVVIALVATPGTGSAQERGASASPEELWRDYPLRPEQEAASDGAGPRSSTAEPPGGAPPRPSEEPADDPGPPAAVIALLVLLALLVVPLLVLLARLAAGRSPPGGPAPEGPREPPYATRDGPGSSAWTAEIAWRNHDGTSRFCVVASPPGGEDDVTLGESPRIEWPPRNAADVDSLAGAVSDLERAAVAAGWEPTDPGGPWYARRFVWPRSDRAPERTLDHARAGDRG